MEDVELTASGLGIFKGLSEPLFGLWTVRVELLGHFQGSPSLSPPEGPPESQPPMKSAAALQGSIPARPCQRRFEEVGCIHASTFACIGSCDGCSKLLHGKTTILREKQLTCLSRAHRGLSRSIFYTRISFSTNSTNTKLRESVICLSRAHRGLSRTLISII